ncbi:predicted protein [Nematostella vectensis]|uniref:J domain-containing protein n=1 Tax=Nematostella vectensis TaxID=45351 RepID=A7SL50_NEMVE|nr:predicted protein [Nematostella vectensis]|eukprot:XP_001627698.1 predicted protein [Nematostella vectensis]
MVLTRNFLILSLAILCFTPVVQGFVEGLYCGTENCYDVLGVTRESNKGDDKENAIKKFQLIATAYETLKDPEQRNDYDYMLDHPEETYRHYYHYYRHRMAPKVDVRIVVAYLHGWSRYNEAVQYALSVPKYRNKAIQKAHEDGLLNGLRKRGKRSKEEMKEEEESILRSVVESSLEIRGGHCKPSIMDVLWIRIVLFAPILYMVLDYLTTEEATVYLY